MYALLQLFFALLNIDPEPATRVAAVWIDKPRLAHELRTVCRRESRCERISVHTRDRWAGPKMYKKALKVGWLQEWCPWHADAEDPHRFGVRGSFGLSAAYSLRFIGPCVPPEVLDIPIFSAYAAAKRMQAQCELYDACSRQGYRRFWAGARRYDKRKQRNAPVKPEPDVPETSLTAINTTAIREKADG